MKQLKQFLAEQKSKVFLTLLLLIGQSVGTLLIPFLIANIVDNGILAGNMQVIINIGIIMLIVAIISAAIAITGSWRSADLAALFGYNMRQKLIEKSQELSINEFDDLGVSSMVTRSTSDISNMQMTFGLVLQLMVPAPIMMIASVFMTFRVNPTLAVLLIICMCAFLVFAVFMLKFSGRLARKIQSRMDKINQMVREAITGTRVIRAFGNENYEEERSGKAYLDYAGTMIRLNKMFAIVNPVVWITMGVCISLIVWIGGQATAIGTMEVGQITASIEYSILTLSYLIMAAQIATMLPKMRSCLDRLEEVLAINPLIKDAPAKESVAWDNNAPIVDFQNVTFSYMGAEEPILQDITFSCKLGETTAIIGGTGSGKSTIADLLLRLHDIDKGNITLKGVNIKEIVQEDLRNSIGYVPQKSFLFSGTIEDNLRMGKEDAKEEVLWEALKTAQADTFVSNLSDGLSAPVAQGGGNFSGGQRQRLAIARALVKNTEVYVFDDSFSALDVKTDGALRKALKDYGKGAAKIIIAQRVSTIIDADQIIVLDNGIIVGKGKHKELLNTCTVYKDIVNSQMEQKED